MFFCCENWFNPSIGNGGLLEVLIFVLNSVDDEIRVFNMQYFFWNSELARIVEMQIFVVGFQFCVLSVLPFFD